MLELGLEMALAPGAAAGLPVLLGARELPGPAATEVGEEPDPDEVGAGEGGATRGDPQRGQGKEGRERYWKTACTWSWCAREGEDPGRRGWVPMLRGCDKEGSEGRGE